MDDVAIRLETCRLAVGDGHGRDGGAWRGGFGAGRRESASGWSGGASFEVPSGVQQLFRHSARQRLRESRLPRLLVRFFALAAGGRSDRKAGPDSELVLVLLAGAARSRCSLDP